MSEPVHCGECGALLPPYWPKGLCAGCAFLGILDAPESETRVAFGDEPPSPETHIGRYTLLGKLGEGGFGAVWMADQHEPVKRRIALKILKLGMDTKQVVARFETERQALAMMDHPNIARILDGGSTASGRPFFAMELVRGVPITTYCDREHLSTNARLNLFMQVCQAIQHAHQKGIIHRDIKPSNILVTDLEGVPVPKVIDFGIAKATLGELADKTLLTQIQQFMGTPAYMSPEQADMSGIDIDTRSDIYSLGILLYELLTGSTPFDATELMASGVDAMRRTIREQEPPRPSTRVSRRLAAHNADSSQPNSESVPISRANAVTAEDRRHQHELINTLKGDLDWVVMKCLEKDRGRRYETANGVAMDVQRFLANEPVVARPPSVAYKVQKAWRRNKVLYVAGLIAGVALLAGILGTALGLARANHERSRTQAANEELARNLYFEKVALAHRELTAETANVREAEKLLTQCQPSLRDWEWDYLKRGRYSDQVVLPDSAGNAVHSVSFSADGQRLAAGSSDGQVRIWKIPAGTLDKALNAHTGFVASVAFSPKNPAWIASAGSDRQLVLSDWTTGQRVRSWPAEIVLGNGLAYAVAFSPDGKLLAAPAINGEVVIRDTATGQTTMTLPGHKEVAVCVSFSADGRWIGTGTDKGLVQLWNARTGKKVDTAGPADQAIASPPITSLAFSLDGKRLISLHVHGLITMWDTENHRELPSYSAGNARLSALAIHPRSSRLFVGGSEGLVTLWEPARKRQLLVFRELARSCSCLVLSPDGHRLAAGSTDGTVRLWDASPLQRTDDRSVRTLDYPSEVWALSTDRRGHSLAVAGLRPPDAAADSSAPVLVWSGPGFNPPERRIQPGQSVITFSLDYSPTGRFLASAGDGESPNGGAPVKVWDQEADRKAFPVEGFAGAQVIFSVAFSHDGRWLVGGGRDRKLKVWSGLNGQHIRVLGEHAEEITKVAFSPDGKYFASRGDDDTTKLWDATRLNEAQQPLHEFKGHCEDYSDSIAFSPDSTRFAMVSDHDTTIIHDLRNLAAEPVRLTSRGHQPLALAFSPDGRWIASGGGDCTVKIWNARTGMFHQNFKGHSDRVTRLSFLQNPEGLLLASGSRDRTVKLWDMAGTR